jgi:4-alpha-glucanotransferase
VKAARLSGLLLHPTSLPGPWGIGDLGAEAVAFLDFAKGAGQGLWQVLPLGPTGYGDSPYQCFSAFAGNPLLVSLDRLRDEGLLAASDLPRRSGKSGGDVDYGAVIEFKRPRLRKAALAFERDAGASEQEAFAAFWRAQSSWLDDYALFMALKEASGGRSWHLWERDLRERDQAALDKARSELSAEIDQHRFAQYLFFRQWTGLRAEARSRGIRILGDLPIFVAHDSADVWAHPGIFSLAADGSPAFVAGVPPDYFSATGQLWGNPLYRWDVIARSGFAFWIDRFRSALSLFDMVRLDHFRGFEAYWEVPGTEPTAVKGGWVKGPGTALFEAVESALGPLPVVAENLGLITPEVEALRERFSWPGMAILQFAFGGDAQSTFLPHNYARRTVVYTGSHDNDTARGWWEGGVGDSTRSKEDVEKERAFARDYLGTTGAEIHWDLIRAVLTSVAEIAVVPLQDVLGLGREARMNVPSRAAGNWRWRYERSQLTDGVKGRLRRLVEISGRLPPEDPPAPNEPAGDPA